MQKDSFRVAFCCGLLQVQLFCICQRDEQQKVRARALVSLALPFFIHPKNPKAQIEYAALDAWTSREVPAVALPSHAVLEN